VAPICAWWSRVGNCRTGEHHKQNRPRLEPAIEPIAEQSADDHAGNQLDAGLHAGPAVLGPIRRLRLATRQIGRGAQTTHTIIEILELRRPILARHDPTTDPGLADCPAPKRGQN
jgi:hypothetical protein